MQNLLRPGGARQFTSVAAFCERRLFFPSMGVAKMVVQMYDEKSWAVTDRRYSTAGVRVLRTTKRLCNARHQHRFRFGPNAVERSSSQGRNTRAKSSG